MEKFKTILKKWWPYLLMFVFLLTAMNVIETTIYVSKATWYSIQGVIVLLMLSIFKWG